MPSQPSLNDLLTTLEREFTETFEIKLYEPATSTSTETENLADLDFEMQDVEALLGEELMQQAAAEDYQASVDELIQAVEQSLTLVQQLKQAQATNQVRSHVTDLQHLAGEINTLLTHLAQVKGV